ncbi:hypothetical protein MANES_03G101800v8 [Manihot esculenta]|uniref:Uncharacterized protein n=1 Tax=Manihot esculenta TaxID=3983 RepID=A0ACB7I0A7_MANES|nr:hypothetical protein MANES_03G101800v8 [Manihot esculenta]
MCGSHCSSLYVDYITNETLQYVSFMREQLEQLAEERNPDGLPRVSKAKVNDYSQRIEAVASTIAVASYLVSEESFAGSSAKESPKVDGETHFPASLGLRKRFVASSNIDNGTHDNNQVHTSAPVKLDTSAKAHIENHRKLQEDLTDEMVQLAQQLKESSLLMSQSVENTEKILDSTEKAVEQSLASTNHANVRAFDIYSKTSKTTCFTWLLIFLMTCIFIMVVLLIRVT